MTDEIDDVGPQFKARLGKLDVTKMQSEVLAAYVVAYRTLNIDKEFAIACMAELGRRRDLGEQFDFENFIETELAKMPKVESLDVNKISGAIHSSVAAFTNSKR